MPFMCSICAEESTRICSRCTKDACNNHLCEKCLRCSDCCECEITLSDDHHMMTAATARAVISAVKAEPAHVPDPEPDPEPHEPPPDPDPLPDDEPEGPVTV